MLSMLSIHHHRSTLYKLGVHFTTYHIETKCPTVTMTENQITELRTVYSDCLNLHVYRKFVFNFLGHPSLNICFCSFYFIRYVQQWKIKPYLYKHSSIKFKLGGSFPKNKNKSNFLNKKPPSYYDVKTNHTYR